MKLRARVALAVALVGAVPAGALQLGDDVVAFYRARAAAYSASRVLSPLAGWPGYETAVLATDAGFSAPPFVLVVRKSGGTVVPFGTVEGAAEAAALFLDSDGDGRVDRRTARNLVPGWLALKLPGPRGSGAAFRALADRIYRQYDQNAGPAPAQLELLVQNLATRALDPANADRDLDAALKYYVDYAVIDPILAGGALAALSTALKSRGGDHPLVALFRGEALALSGKAEAADQFERLLALDPKSTIGRYKLVQDDPVALEAFRQTHPDFWATRE